MGLLAVIIRADGSFYYDLFYLLAFLVGYILLIWIGVKNKYNLVSWFLLLAGTRFFFIVGTKLFSYSASEWNILFTEHYLPATTGKTLLGGLLLVAIGFYFLKKLLHLKTETLDAFALVIPLSIALQRPGCLLAGCCYGNPTNLSWGVQYLPGTLPHFHQFQAGVLQAGEVYSLPVHPSQLYEALNGLLVVGILLWVKRYIKAPGNYLTASVLLYSFFRFFLEFFRSPLAHSAGGAPVGGLVVQQWGLLVIISLLGFLFWYREKKYTPAAPAPAEPPNMSGALLLMLGLVVITWGLRDWFTYTELLALNMALYPAIAWVSLYFFHNFMVPQFRWLALAVLVLPVFLMSQTLPPDQIKFFHTVKVGYGSGNYQNSYSIGQGSGCDRVANTKYFQQEYTLGGAGYAYTKKQENGEVTYGLNGYLGEHQEIDITTGVAGASRETTIYGLNPYVRRDWEYFGLGVGLHVGNLRYTLEDKNEDGNGTPAWGSKKTPVYPQVNLRIGPTRIIFADFRLADQFPAAFPGFRYQASIGSGFGLRNGTFARFGTNGTDPFVGAHLVLQNKLVLEPLFLWSNSPSFMPSLGKQRQFAIGLHYRFNQK